MIMVVYVSEMGVSDREMLIMMMFMVMIMRKIMS